MSSKSSSQIDRLIAESKQVTSDLMALRHEMGRRPRAQWPAFGGPMDRAFMISANIHRIAEELYDLRKASREPEPEPEYIDEPKPRALGNGQLRLTSGGR